MIKKDMLEVVQARIQAYRNQGFTNDEARGRIIPTSVCTLGDLEDLLMLLPASALAQAIHDQEDRDTAETLADFCASGHHI